MARVSQAQRVRWYVQAAKMETSEKRKADALASVSGFAFHIQDAIRNTPADNVSRSRIVDRCLFVGPHRQTFADQPAC